MIDPGKVRPRNFEVIRIIYNDGEFSVARGTWVDDGTPRLGMRWNGGKGEDAGYPKTFGHPVWFILPTILTDVISHALAETSGKIAEDLKKSLPEIG